MTSAAGWFEAELRSMQSEQPVGVRPVGAGLFTLVFRTWSSSLRVGCGGVCAGCAHGMID